MRSNINKLCESKGLTLYRLARMAGITDRALYKYEREGLNKAQFGCLVKVAKALDCRLEDLYKEDPSE